MWTPPEPPPNEGARLAELHSLGLLDTLPEERFDRITRLAARFYRADVAFLSFIDGTHQWMKAKTSADLHDFIERDRSVCTMVVSSGTELVIDDMRTAPELVGHPLARDMPWRFYASVPLRGEHDHIVGSLCILRSDPGAPPEFSTDILRDLAEISSHEMILAKRNAELRRISNTDSLTGLANRRMFDETLQRAWRRSRRTGEEVSLLMLDLDHFKEVNDSLGHHGGDSALVTFADFLSPFARRPEDVVARVGGEEFAVLLSGTDTVGAETVARRLLGELAAADIAHPRRGRLTVSIGVATLTAAEDIDAWRNRADRGLYAAKTSGRAAARVG